jgi:dolichol kinase
MVDLFFGDMTTMDLIMAGLTGVLSLAVLATAFRMALKGTPKWQTRKIVHVSLGTFIALTVPAYSNLSGPTLAGGIFLTVLIYAWAHKSNLISELLISGSREGESGFNTFASAFMGMIAFISVFILFMPEPSIFVASILAVSWGDAAGEAVGRPLGGKYVRRKLGQKSVEGSVAVLVFTSIAILTALALFSSVGCPLCIMPQILLIGAVIAIVEILSIGWIDNFVIPFATALLMWVLLFPGLTIFGM